MIMYHMKETQMLVAHMEHRTQTTKKNKQRRKTRKERFNSSHIFQMLEF